MTKIDLEFECTAPEGKCAWKDSLGECITTDENDESWVCWYLRAKAAQMKEVKKIEESLYR